MYAANDEGFFSRQKGRLLRPPDRRASWGFLMIGVVLVGLCVFSLLRGDYEFYRRAWEAIAGGALILAGVAGRLPADRRPAVAKLRIIAATLFLVGFVLVIVAQVSGQSGWPDDSWLPERMERLLVSVGLGNLEEGSSAVLPRSLDVLLSLLVYGLLGFLLPLALLLGYGLDRFGRGEDGSRR